ncbi:unnamed protein product [Adineta steineri]|uniref:Uncharacterized protein n=1 Tax=Adineta steineri TaxID=433720 RepID=A0A819PWS2_9BILA|nr:unnamed protein product [Adineta steineri]CAF4021513.1 unnamed protein product [Adineta steineri]
MSSNVTTLSPEKEKKRPSVSVKCLLNIKSIVTQNISSNRNSRNSLTSTLPPLPLVDPLVSPKQSINHSNSTKEIEEATSKTLQSSSNQNVVIKCLEKSFNEQISPNNEHDQSNIENDNSQSNFDKEQKEIQPIIPIFISKESNSEQIPSQIGTYIDII